MIGCDLHAGLQQALSRSDAEWIVGRSLRPPESQHGDIWQRTPRRGRL